MPITSADTLHDRVLLFHEAIGTPARVMLIDNSREFCGKPEQHPYELLLAMEGIELNRPGFSRHLQAVHYGNHGGVYEREAVFG